MKLKKLLLLPIGLMLSITGCVAMPFSTYYMATTSFHYDPAYISYMVKLNGIEIGGGFGGGISTDPIKIGSQTITWKDTKTGELHTAKNQVAISRAQLKGKKYLAAHIYPDDTVEIVTSNDWPDPTEKGMKSLEQLRKEKKARNSLNEYKERQCQPNNCNESVL